LIDFSFGEENAEMFEKAFIAGLWRGDGGAPVELLAIIAPESDRILPGFESGKNGSLE
jgi:hypothetical protein